MQPPSEPGEQSAGPRARSRVSPIASPAPLATKQETALPWGWSVQRERAAILLAEDYKTDDEIAAEIGIGKRALCGWKKHPVFAERVKSLVKIRRERMLRYRIARDEEMMQDLQRDYDLHEQVRAERGDDITMENVPGGKTGLIVRDFKSVGNGPGARVVPVYEEDHGWFKSRLALQDQARKLLGKADKLEVTGKDGAPIGGVNLTITAEWVELRMLLFNTLEPFPDAKAAVFQAFNEAADAEVST